MRAQRLTDERGVALAVAVFALVVLGALVAGIFYSGRLEQQTGTNTFYAAQATEAAEAGLSHAIATQDASTLLALGAGEFTPLTPFSKAGTSSDRSVTRLANKLFLVRSTGYSTDGAGGELARTSVGRLIRLVEVQLKVDAGLTALGNVTVTGGAEVTGYDEVPPLWQGEVACPPLDSVAGVRYNNGTLTVHGSDSDEKVKGDPPSIKDPTLNPSDMLSTFNKLKAVATLTVVSDNPPETGPVHVGTDPVRCDKSKEYNWGEPSVLGAPCSNYFPIIYHYGNLRLQGGRGQGVLLVEGDLSATGGMVFYGPVFVTGTLSTSGNSNQGAKFYGGVIAGNVDLDDVTKLAGGALVSYSSCAVRRALENTARPTPLAERSWVQLYQ